jgi:hypothetical protein
METATRIEDLPLADLNREDSNSVKPSPRFGPPMPTKKHSRTPSKSIEIQFFDDSISKENLRMSPENDFSFS